MNCDRNALIKAARCFCYLPRTEFNAAVIYALCQWAQAGNHTEDVRGFIERIESAGGEAPSKETLAALDAFIDGLVEDGIYDKMLMVNCIVPDSLIAAQTPLIAKKGYPVWTNVNHTDADLSVNGLKGPADQDPPPGGAGAYLLTGFNPSSDASKDSFGITLVSTDANTNTRSDFAVIEAFRAQLLCGYGGNTAFFDCWDSTLGQGRITGPVGWNNGIGYVSGNRVSLTEAYIYSARTGVAHHQVAGPGGNVNADSLPNLIFPLGCWNLSNNFQQNTIKRFSFAAAHFGLTQSESLKLFNRVQAVRQAFGGGDV